MGLLENKISPEPAAGGGKTIARNTLMLYFRMFFLLFIGLFTSRIVLSALGESDFGIYNVVGGVVAMFSLISGALSSSVSRFITFEMGRGEDAGLDERQDGRFNDRQNRRLDERLNGRFNDRQNGRLDVGQDERLNCRLNQVYSTAVLIQIILSVVVVLLAEPIGIWFVQNKMTIPPERIPAAVNVLHFSILAFVINLMSVPQTASITAHERMSAFASIGLLDGCLRLGVALLIMNSGFDRLVLYAGLIAVNVLLVRLAYGIYCRRHFPECVFRPVFDSGLLKRMFSFAGWNFIGSASGILRDQGGNILVNLFSGPAVNAARGVAVQLNGAVQGFVTNFMTAVNPRITKSYASGDIGYMLSLVRKSSRMSYYLLFVLALPVIFNADFLLGLWLKDVPEHTVLFVQLFMVFTLSESISHPLVTSMLATGRIRNYQITVGGIQLLNLPLSWLFLKAGAMPEVTVVVAVALSQICFAARLVMLRGMIRLSARHFIRKVWLNVVVVSVAALPVPMILSFVLPDGVAFSFIRMVAAAVSAGLSVLFVGCSHAERKQIMLVFMKMLRR